MSQSVVGVEEGLVRGDWICGQCQNSMSRVRVNDRTVSNIVDFLIKSMPCFCPEVTVGPQEGIIEDETATVGGKVFGFQCSHLVCGKVGDQFVEIYGAHGPYHEGQGVQLLQRDQECLIPACLAATIIRVFIGGKEIGDGFINTGGYQLCRLKIPDSVTFFCC